MDRPDNDTAGAKLPAPNLGNLKAIDREAVTAPAGKARRMARLRLAVRACGLDGPPDIEPRQYDLAALALKAVYALTEISALPSRAEVRMALLARIAAVAVPHFMMTGPRSQKLFTLDPFSRSLYLSFAGLRSGTLTQADAKLLREAFKIENASTPHLASAILKAAPRLQHQEPPPPPEPEMLDNFALSIRKLARNLETKPFAGRVAIAQVYDAAIGEGLNFGSLDDFKGKLADAAREGLLDLERYDIAGQLDAALQERSRLRLGRDERHFIVN